MGKREVRPQTQKDRERSRALAEARRSLAAQARPVRNRKRYSRDDFRNAAQRGNFQED